jgi:hypothetical protein
MWCIDKDNSAWKSWNQNKGFKQHWKVCEDAVQYADIVTVTTEALARHYGRKHHRTAILPNCIPQAAVDLPRHENDRFYAGWAGFTKTHPGDCTVSAPAARAVLEVGERLRVISDAPGAAREWGIDPSLVDFVPSQKLGPDWFNAVGLLDLMLVGLLDTPFNRAKSTLKALEAGARGVPAIVPDNPPHRALARTGFPVTLAGSPIEWYTAAKHYASLSRADQWEVGGWVQEKVAEKHTIEGNAWRWAEAWERAMNRRR